ncbi:MAG TPA: hydantoinase/oxoprolinase family protein, partial [Candidatus Polarisedimenticolia bacterium]|nr:hydantoinase/oxoprolinase family protein [Candidatus Polarisedimenticolia bacterium]
GAARLIAFDMGGTSTDVSLIAGEPATAGSAVVAGHPVAVPALNIHTVGAGGGSIGWRDPGGALRVGPASAGAEPGPACYGKGGPATVTDANVLLGRIVPERFLDGRMPLDSGAARAAMEELGAGLRMTAEAAAEGMLEVAEATMARAVRVISLQRGHEPSDFALLAFGGAGGLHAAALASSLGMTEVIVPAHPGVFSAWGMTVADIMRDASASILRPAAEVQPGWLAARREALERDLLSLLASDGAPPGCVLFECRLDLRYAGQSFELTIPLPAPDRPQARLEAFHHEHRRRYGYDRPGAPVELVALRVRGIGRTGATPPGRVDPSGRSMHAAQAGRRPVLWRGRRLEASLYDRSRLPVSEASAGLPHGGTLQGPALILEGGATTFVPPGWRARLDPAGHLRLAAEPAR